MSIICDAVYLEQSGTLYLQGIILYWQDEKKKKGVWILLILLIDKGENGKLDIYWLNFKLDFWLTPNGMSEQIFANTG